MTFALHPKLAEDCTIIGDMSFCRVLLMNNRHFPWLILVPMQEGARELFDLDEKSYATVMAEVRQVAERFSTVTAADKMNVAALGNMVPQLHIHIISRHTDDAAWPQPVWSSPLPPSPYSADRLAVVMQDIRRALNITKM